MADPQPIEQTTEGEIKDVKDVHADPASVVNEKDPALLNQKDPPVKEEVPEKYADFKVPEGYTLDETTASEAGVLFKELGLPQAKAQQLVDFYVKQTTEALDAPFKLWGDTQKQWIDQVKSDPDIGGKLPEVRATINKAIDSLGDAKLATEFRQAMDFTGAGNNPAFIRLFHKLAQAVTEGTHVSGGGPSPHGQNRPGTAAGSAAKAMYPDLP